MVFLLLCLHIIVINVYKRIKEICIIQDKITLERHLVVGIRIIIWGIQVDRLELKQKKTQFIEKNCNFFFFKHILLQTSP